MATHQEHEAIGALQAVLNLYGADAYGDILFAFSNAAARFEADDDRRASRLTDNLLGVIRRRQAKTIARFAGPFPSQDRIS